MAAHAHCGFSCCEALICLCHRTVMMTRLLRAGEAGAEVASCCKVAVSPMPVGNDVLSGLAAASRTRRGAARRSACALPLTRTGCCGGWPAGHLHCRNQDDRLEMTLRCGMRTYVTATDVPSCTLLTCSSAHRHGAGTACSPDQLSYAAQSWLRSYLLQTRSHQGLALHRCCCGEGWRRWHPPILR